MIKISFVIPVYNTEEFLNKCINSIRNQTLRDIEIIIVNDGSNDNSERIIEKHKIEDYRIRVINQENSGLSQARNIGISISQGEYIVLVDGDDWVDESLAEKVYSKLKTTNSDMCIYGIKYVFESGIEINKSFYPTIKREVNNIEALKMLFNSEGFKCHSVNKVCKRTLYDNIKFPKGLIFEDISTTYKLILECKKICFINEKLYYYLQARSNSIMNNNFNEKKLVMFKIMGEIEDKLRSLNIYSLLENEYRVFFLDNIIGLINMYCISNFTNNKLLLNNIKAEIKKIKYKEIITSNLNYSKKIQIIYAKTCISLYVKFVRYIKLIKSKI